MDNFKEKGVWDIVDRPTDRPVVGGRWHSKFKMAQDGTILKFKACYIAKGLNQTEGVDYTETFSPTGRLASLRILIALAAHNRWEIHAMDAIAAFLNGVLKRNIFMELPEEYFEEERSAGKIARLQNAVYGLKQSAFCWNNEFKEKFQSIGLFKNHHDPCLWFRR